jgi:hypothetical protein
MEMKEKTKRINISLFIENPPFPDFIKLMEIAKIDSGLFFLASPSIPLIPSGIPPIQANILPEPHGVNRVKSLLLIFG